jgi:hypothetical protein
LIPTETNIEVFVKPFGHFAVDRQRICRELNLVQIGSTPFDAIFEALVVLAKHFPVREYCRALVVAMQTVLAVLAVQMTLASDRAQEPVLVVEKMTCPRPIHNLEVTPAPAA